MKVKALHCFKSKLLKPCKRFFPTFKFKLKRPLFIRRAFHLRPRQTTQTKVKNPSKNPLSGLLAALCSCLKTKETNRIVELKSFSGTNELERLVQLRASDTMPSPSHLMPAYVKPSSRAGKREAALGGEAVEDACRSFENYLVEMIIEEGKVEDLMDVEELLYCWKSLKCPVFIDLVCRFYGELCKDLFSADRDEVDVPSDPAF